MRRNFLTGLLIVLLPTLLAGVYVGWAFTQETRGGVGFRRGIDLAGGTILVYEVNLDATRRDAADPAAADATAQGLSTEEIRKLAESLKRRIDPNDLKNVIVRPVGTTRVEIILPFAGSTGGGKEGVTEDFVQEVKGLVRQVGVLEFRILANFTDDPKGVEDAEALVRAVGTDPKVKERFEAAAKAGLPPPAPDDTYPVLGEEGVRYEWVELGTEEMETLLLDRDDRNRISLGEDGAPRLSQLAQAIKAKPGEAFRHEFPAGRGEHAGKMVSMLLYRRPFTKAMPSRDEEGTKAEYFVLTRVSPHDVLKVDRDVGLRASAENDPNSGNPTVRFGFNATGASRFGRMTERNRPTQTHLRSLAIVMDKRVVSAPTLNDVLRDGGTISGNFTMASVNQLVHVLRSGALNAELKPDPVSENTVGPTLGQDTVRSGLLAIGLSFAAVLAFMVVYYRFAGLVACVALLLNLLLTVGFMVAVNAAFTLPGMAGIVLMLGMAVDANVLIYERIREEREKGANLATAIRLGYDRAFATIIDTHLTSIFTCLVLYTFGNDQLKGFAVSLTLGLIISLFTALYVTRLMFDYWQHKRWLSQLRMLRLFSRTKFDFMRVRYPMFLATAVLTVLGLGLFLARGEDVLNVDFTKGTAYGGRLVEPRGLSDAGGKPGLLTLLGEPRQNERLRVAEGDDGVQWLTKPVATEGDAAQRATTEYIYKIVYEDEGGRRSDVTVTLANPPEGATEEAQRADLRRRASELPGLSVEQVQISGLDDDLPRGTTRSFTVRTTEKEPELEQAMLDRLLRTESGEQLLAATNVTDVQVVGPVVTVTLDQPASPRYFERFLVRELTLANRMPAVGGAPAVEVTGVPAADPAVAAEEGRTGRYRTLRVDVSKNTEFRALAEQGTQSTRLGAALGGVAVGGVVARSGAAGDEAAFRQVLASAEESFEARPMPDRLETFDPALAADTRNKALYAILASWMAILAYLWFRFGNWTFGLAAVLCLVHDLCFTLGAIAACHYVHDTWLGQALGLQDFKIDLAAVAALLTLIGFSVNDTIVVFDRIREVRGKNPQLTPAIINESVNGTLSRTVLASLTVFLVVGVLYWFGGPGVHLFSFVMVVGVIVGTYSSIYVASPLLLMLGEGKERTGDQRGRATQPATATA